MIDVTSVRHTWPEKSGFGINRLYGHVDYTFLHFYNSVELVINDQKIQTSPHAVILYSPQTPQYFISKDPLIHDWFHFAGDLGINFDRFKTDTVLYPNRFEFITKTTAEIENEFFNNRKNRNNLIESLVKELFIRIDRSLFAEDSDQNKVSSDIEELFRSFRRELFSSLNKKWTVSDMAKTLNFSESRFFALYKTIFGISPTADLINARINSAKNILIFQNKKIEDIATSLGYDNVTHFIRQFKTFVGETPNMYRKNNK